MNPRSILRMDRLLGGPASAALSLAAGLGRLFRPPRQAAPRRIVFIKLIEMGSSVIACPAFAEAERMVGRENLFILVFKPNRAILDVLPYFPPGNILTIDDSSLARFVSGLLAALVRIRRAKIDTAIDLEGLTRSSAIITYLTGAACRVGYHNYSAEGPARGRLFTHELNYGFQRHVGKMFLALVRAARGDPRQVPLLKEPVDDADLALPTFTPTDEEKRAVSSKIDEAFAGGARGPLVLLNPNCSDLLPLRRWPREYLVQLARRVVDEIPGARVVMTGSKSERTDAEELAAEIARPGGCASLAGKTTMRELLTLYGLSDVLVSNDSGPVHFASLTSIRIIALFGPETPLLYGPLGARAVSISAGLACSPCVNMLNHRFSPCHDNVCMKSIPVAQIFDHVRAAIARG